MNKVLERQLKKAFGSLEAVPKDIQKLLDLVSATYDHAEEDRVLMERSMEISSKEMGELNDRLKKESEVMKMKLDELAQAEKSEKSSQEILDNMQEGCQIIGPDWRFLYLNGAQIKQNKQTKEELLGHTMMERYPGIEKTELFARLKLCMEKREPQELETEFVFPDGSKGWFLVKVEPVPRGIFIISSDITLRKRGDEEIKKRNDEMERLNKLMIDRELRMIELKKRIIELETKANGI